MSQPQVLVDFECGLRESKNVNIVELEIYKNHGSRMVSVKTHLPRQDNIIGGTRPSTMMARG